MRKWILSLGWIQWPSTCKALSPRSAERIDHPLSPWTCQSQWSSAPYPRPTGCCDRQGPDELCQSLRGMPFQRLFGRQRRWDPMEWFYLAQCTGLLHLECCCEWCTKWTEKIKVKSIFPKTWWLHCILHGQIKEIVCPYCNRRYLLTLRGLQYSQLSVYVCVCLLHPFWSQQPLAKAKIVKSSLVAWDWKHWIANNDVTLQ